MVAALRSLLYEGEREKGREREREKEREKGREKGRNGVKRAISMTGAKYSTIWRGGGGSKSAHGRDAHAMRVSAGARGCALTAAPISLCRGRVRGGGQREQVGEGKDDAHLYGNRHKKNINDNGSDDYDNSNNDDDAEDEDEVLVAETNADVEKEADALSQSEGVIAVATAGYNSRPSIIALALPSGEYVHGWAGKAATRTMNIPDSDGIGVSRIHTERVAYMSALPHSCIMYIVTVDYEANKKPIEASDNGETLKGLMRCRLVCMRSDITAATMEDATLGEVILNGSPKGLFTMKSHDLIGHGNEGENSRVLANKECLDKEEKLLHATF